MTGVLLIQLGTPDSPTPSALRPYLRQFLTDPRVIEVPRWKWWFVLNLLVLPFRPRQSAAKYQRIWDPRTGSPLLHHTRRAAEALQGALPQVRVAFGMQVGNPPLAGVVRDLLGRGVDRLVVLPLYPQYSATTTASAYDALFAALRRERRLPALRVIRDYHDHPAYLDAVTAVARDDLARLPWEPEHYLISFHGIPVRYGAAGDPYPEQVARTTAGLVPRLGWPAGRWTQTFQSRFGREPWLEPYTEETLVGLAKKGVKRVFVVTPGFTADCLETLDEIGNETRAAFRHAGGEELRLCPCLNDHPAWVAAMRTLVLEEGRGWFG